MEKFIHNNTIIAIRLKSLKNGATPITDPDEPLQVVTHKHRKAAYIKPHIHTPKKRMTNKLEECLVVTKGKIKIDLYNTQGKFFKSIYLSAGQIVMFINGGHAVHVVKDCEIIEVKNGPFIEDKDLIT